ncbi:biopolymer transporter TonB [Hyphomicrobium nitrativorans NL23]|uniref:Biopolymer transporter TonB n=1 Tax=Hyphomicrobium nitrativorans NL23 TaxID=1029756 RepID=V5SFH5_9HYPH|nr:energy transducer TonB [Hyphomicrobium nitrativorans]AHB49252.1 biopolymer transporter TonB [Hyphomicrobium nitrativorans NL23]
MPLQAIAIILSLVLHGLVGNALWQRLQHDRPQVFDLGERQDIILEPQGLDLSEVTNIGDDLQSVDTQAAIPIEQHAPPPPAVAALRQPEDMVDDVSHGAIRDVFAIDPQDPPPQDSARTAPEQVRDVIASEHSTVEQDLVDAREALPDLVDEHDFIAANQSALDDVKEPNVAVRSDAAPPHSLTPAQALPAEQPTPPEEIAQAALRAPPARLPPPDRIEESAPEHSEEPPSPLLPMDERQPDFVEVVAQPDQVVIVTEHSSGEEKKGGDATIVGLYLGKINEQVQRSKVNPRSRRTGTVVVKFTVGTDGALLSKDVMTSSGAEVLDRAAIAALERASPFPPIPPDVSRDPMTFTQSFRFVVR